MRTFHSLLIIIYSSRGTQSQAKARLNFLVTMLVSEYDSDLDVNSVKLAPIWAAGDMV